MTAKRMIAAFACAVAVACCLTAALSATSPPSEASRKILPDGTIQIQYSNGVVKVVPPSSPGPALQMNPQAASGAGTDQALPAGPDLGGLDPATRAKYAAALTAYYDYRISGYRHREDVFAWQFLSSKIIFWVVLLIVFAGILFSAIQFFRGAPKKNGKSETSDITEMEASLQGIKVSSPVLGVVILTISIAFFYLYLVFVYPINNVF
jgi:hypothetical protein